MEQRDLQLICKIALRLILLVHRKDDTFIPKLVTPYFSVDRQTIKFHKLIAASPQMFLRRYIPRLSQ